MCRATLTCNIHRCKLWRKPGDPNTHQVLVFHPTAERFRTHTMIRENQCQVREDRSRPDSSKDSAQPALRLSADKIPGSVWLAVGPSPRPRYSDEKRVLANHGQFGESRILDGRWTWIRARSIVVVPVLHIGMHCSVTVAREHVIL